MSVLITRGMALIALSLVAHISQAATLIGTPSDVTGVTDLQISYGGTTYIYDVSFVTGNYNAAFPSAPPTFLNNFEGAQIAATALSYLFTGADVTSVNGAIPIPITPGGAVQEELFTPYELQSSPYGNTYLAEETDYISNRSPPWIPVGPGCCEGETDVPGNPAALAVYTLVSESPTPVPEPGPLMLSVAGLGLMLFFSRRRARGIPRHRICAK